MPQKIKLTRPELKRYRDRLARCEHYLPMLKLKQQQLQMRLRDAEERRRKSQQILAEAEAKLAVYRTLLSDCSGVPLTKWTTPDRVVTSPKNVAGIEIRVLEDALFPKAAYSLFGTPPWVDEAIIDLRKRSHAEAASEIIREEESILQRELRHVVQHVNLFEKVLIPHYQEAIRRIRIRLGDEMTAAIGRAKIAKAKIASRRRSAHPAQPREATP